MAAKPTGARLESWVAGSHPGLPVSGRTGAGRELQVLAELLALRRGGGAPARRRARLMACGEADRALPPLGRIGCRPGAAGAGLIWTSATCLLPSRPRSRS